MIAMLALTVALAAPAGELMWWRPDAPGSGLAIGDGGVWRGIGTGRSEWWPLDGDPPRLMPRTTPCPSVLESFDPPRARLPDMRLTWGPVLAMGWSERCALTSTAAGPLVRYHRGAVAGVIPRETPARLVATDAACARGAVVDDETLSIFPLGGAQPGVSVPLGRNPTDMRLTAEAAIIADLDGALTLFRPDGTRLADIDPGAPLGCAATGRGLVVIETVEAGTGAYAMADGALRWGRAAVDSELGQAWSVEPPSPITALTADPTGRWIAAVVDGTARLWSPIEGAFHALPGPALDVAFDEDGARLAVRAPDAVLFWRFDGDAPRAGRRIAVPHRSPAEERADGPQLAWLPGGRLVTLSDEGLVPVLGIRGDPLRLDAPRAIVAVDGALHVIAATGSHRIGVSRGLKAGRRGSRRGGPTRGARVDCEGAPVAWSPGGWRRLVGATEAEAQAIRLCAGRSGSTELALLDGGALATTVIREPGQPPTRREIRAPLFGDIQAIALHPGGRISALLDGRAVVRWQPGAVPERLTWVVVDGQDVVAGDGRISGPGEALKSLSWWRSDGVVPATDVPRVPVLVMSEGTRP